MTERLTVGGVCAAFVLLVFPVLIGTGWETVPLSVAFGAVVAAVVPPA